MFSLRRWDSIRQRPQQLASELSRSFRVLYVDPAAYSVPGYIRRRIRGGDGESLRPTVRPISDMLAVFTPPPLLPFSQESLLVNRVTHHLLAAMVQRQLSVLDMTRPIAWLTHPTHLPLLERLGCSLICYDCMDRYADFFPDGSARKRMVMRLEGELIRCADLVVASAERLQARLQQVRPDVFLVRNAVGREFLDYQADRSIPASPGWPAGDGPVIGYVGTISHWIEFDAIERMADRHPEWRLVIIGPVRVDPAILPRRPNIHWLGPRQHDQLPAYVARFDVGLIPFRLSDLTREVNPVKLYEYFALGKPVVATPLPELLPFEDLCYLAEGAKGLIEKTEIAVQEMTGPDRRRLEDARREIARENTWAVRATQIGHLLQLYGAGKNSEVVRSL